MSKEIWLGPVLGTNRERLLKRCAEYLSAGEADRMVYLAASHPLLDLVTEKLLDGKNARGVWGDFPVYLFRGFVRRILSSAVMSGDQGSGAAGNDARALLTQSLTPRVPIDREDLPLRRSLISQIIKKLANGGRLSAIKRLANRDGCVNTIASLIGELQRAGKTPAEFHEAIENRASEVEPKPKAGKSRAEDLPHSQVDFDREVGVIYEAYLDALARFSLTDDDADQLRALQILRGELDGDGVSVPWLKNIDLLVLDGFFDFTPVQAEMLRQLIPSIPNVIVNVNADHRNQEIFAPFQSTLEYLQSIAGFDTQMNAEEVTVSQPLAPLRSHLFNVDAPSRAADPASPDGPPVQLFECSDREVEVRAIAKEIKSLILRQGYQLADIGLVVRERAAYADTIIRVFADEHVACNLERRLEAQGVPSVRACRKLFQILRETNREHLANPKANELADLVKSEYFRASRADLEELTEQFDSRYGYLLEPELSESANAGLRKGLGIGTWSPDVLENVIAYVGGELRVRKWLDRAQLLIDVLPSPEAAESFIGGAENEGDDAASIAEQEPPAEDAPVKEKTKRPAPVHPAAIAWTMLVMDHLRQTIAGVPEEGTAEDLRKVLMMLLEKLEFSRQVRRPLRKAFNSTDVPQAIVDVRGLESLRRALAATVRSFQMAESVSEGRVSRETPVEHQSAPITMSSFIDELERCVTSQVLSVSAGDRDGLQVLEATDVRGLRFRVMFIAGMIEGGFPLRASRDWLYPHEERERLKKYGVVLEDISTETLLKEEHYFYQCACRATERLYLTRPLAAANGDETVPSYYIEELRRAIAPAEIKTTQVRSDVDDRDLTSASTVSELTVELVRHSTRQGARSPSQNRLPAPVAAKLLATARNEGYVAESILRRVAIELERCGDSFGPRDGLITNRELRAVLERHFGADYIYSASGLSAYGNCPFKFFAARVLKLQPRNEAALDLPAIDSGKLLHDILRRFFERHRNEYLPSHDRHELRDEMNRIASEVFAEHQRLVPPMNERVWKIDCEIRKLILEQVLLYELRLQERTRTRGMRPAYFELAFGRASQASDPASSKQFLKLTRDGAKSEVALIQGQIDRVDVDQGGEVAIAYDYKLSQGAKLDDIETGRQVQIPIYLAALEQLFVPGHQLAGGGYYRLRGRGSRLNQGLYRKMFEDCTELTYHRAKLDDIEWQRIRREVSRRVWEFIEGMRAGDFRVKPSLGKFTCKFCDYAAVCRYDTYRISRKH